MKRMTFLLVLLLIGCSTKNSVAYRQVIVPSPTNNSNPWNDNPTIDVTTTTISYF